MMAAWASKKINVSVSSLPLLAKKGGDVLAERRMFHRWVVESDQFLDLPLSAQALYFHLGMAADDDGFLLGVKRTCRVVGATDEDLKCLIENSYLLDLGDGVMLIRHWRVSNTLKNDRIKIPACQDKAANIYLLQNREYTVVPFDGCESLLEYRSKAIQERKASRFLSRGSSDAD